MPSAISRVDANGIAFVLSLLAAIGAAVSPFNTFLRSKYFSDGYHWRGLNRPDTAPMFKTIALTFAFVALAAGIVLQGQAASHFCYWFSVSALAAFAGFSLWHSLRKARRARESRN